MANENVTAGMDAELVRYLFGALDTISDELGKIGSVACAGAALCEKTDSPAEGAVFETIVDMANEGNAMEKLHAIRKSIEAGAIRI